MLIQNFLNYKGIFSKDIFSRYFQLKFKNFKIIENVSLKYTFIVFKITKMFF